MPMFQKRHYIALATTLYKARSTGEVSKVLEIAAEGALGGTLGHALANEAANDKHAPAKAPAQDMAICLVEVPRSKLVLVEQLVRAIGARCITD